MCVCDCVRVYVYAGVCVRVWVYVFVLGGNPKLLVVLFREGCAQDILVKELGCQVKEKRGNDIF